MLLGEPNSVTATIGATAGGVDESCSVTLRYPRAMATISASVVSTLSNEAVVTGTRARVRVAAPFFNPGFAEVTFLDEPHAPSPKKAAPENRLPLVDRLPFVGLAQGAFWSAWLRRRGRLILRRPGQSGLKLEAIEFMRCVRESQLESDTMRGSDTIAVARILDQARQNAESSPG